MDIGRGQQFTTTRRHPGFACAGLTLRAVPITAAVVRDRGTMSAAGALIDMATESSGATARAGQQDLEVSPTEPRTVARDEVCSALRMISATSHCGRLIYSSADDLPFFSTSASSGLGVACRCRCERW